MPESKEVFKMVGEEMEQGVGGVHVDILSMTIIKVQNV